MEPTYFFGQQQAAHVQARLVNAVVAPPGAAELQGAGDFLPGAQGEHVPAVGVVADGGVGLVGKAQALAHVEVYLHHRQGQELVVDHHLGQGGGVVLGGVFLLEGGLHLQALAPQPVVQDNLKDVQRRQQKEDTKRRHVTWTNLPWAGARTESSAWAASFWAWEEPAMPLMASRWAITGTPTSLISSGVTKRPALHQGLGLGGPQQRQGAPGAYAQIHAPGFPGGPGQVHNVLQQHRVDVQLAGRRLQGHNLLGLAHGAQLLQGLAGLEALQDLALLLPGGQVHGKAHEEPIQLGLGQGVGAQGLHGVLGGDDEEGRGQPPGFAVHGDLALGHALQQGGLGAGGGALIFVGQQNVAEHRPRGKLELPGLVVEEV